MSGRPSTFNQEVANEICQRISLGESLRAICASPGMPTKACVMGWLQDNRGFVDQYAGARARQAEHYADELVEIGDSEPDPAKARVRIDARKWIASKLLPKVYGERQSLDIDLKHSFAELSDSELNAELGRLSSQALIPITGPQSGDS